MSNRSCQFSPRKHFYKTRL